MITNNKWLVALNPQSGNGKAGKDWQKIASLLTKANIDFEVVKSTKHRETITQVKEKVEEGFSKIITVGGDGTLHHVANGLMLQNRLKSHEIPVGMISVGTGNDWVRYFEIPKKYEKAIEVIKQGKTNTQDIGKATYFSKEEQQTEYFINFAGIGFDAYVVEKTAHLKKYGQIAYLLGLLKYMFRYKGQSLKIEVDGVVVAEEAFFMMIAGLGRYGGGGMMLCPNAKINDGLLDLSLIGDLTTWEIITQLKNLFNGQFINHSKVNTLQGKHIKITALENEKTIKTETDGELMNHGPFEMEVINNALTIFVP